MVHERFEIMMDTLQPYPVMKDSGVEWLGEVPEHWEVLPNRALFDEIKDRDYPDEQMLSVTIRQGVIRQAALLEDTSKKDSSNPNRSNYKLVQPGDIAYNKMRAWQGAVGVSDHRGIISPAYVAQRPRPGRDSRYYHHLFRTPAFAKEAERWSYGITSDMWSLRPEHFKLIYACLPPLREQAGIVRFLDHVDGRIGRYIRAKQKLMGLLEEQNQAIIHRAVTRGLDPDVPLKPSGVEWLGDVPGHWQVCLLKRSFDVQLGKMLQSAPSSPEDTLEPYLRAANISWQGADLSDVKKMWFSPYEKRQYALKEGDLLVSEGGDVGRSAVWKGELEHCYIQNAINRVRSKGPHATRLLYYWMYALKHSGYIDALCSRATIAHFTAEKVERVHVALPPVAEEHAIAGFLDAETAEIDGLIAKLGEAIDELREYRTCLIADVVTGKLDVREAAANLPDEPDDPQALHETKALAAADEESEMADEMVQ